MITLDRILAASCHCEERSDEAISNKKGVELIKKLLHHPNFAEQIDEWRELGIVDDSFNPSVISSDFPPVVATEAKQSHKLNDKYSHLPIDTKYFKDLELEILEPFGDLDNALDGWLIKSENYQALNTILPKFKERVQTIYIDPPFNTGEDFLYVDRFQDSTWFSLMQDRFELAKAFLKKEGSFYLHIDRNANHFSKIMLNEIFRESNFKAEITWDTCGITGFKSSPNNWIKNADNLLYYSKSTADNSFTKIYSILEKEEKNKLNIGWLDILGEEKSPYVEEWTSGSLTNIPIKTQTKLHPVGMLWTDIYSFLFTQVGNNESFFFKTQKPEHLLRRIIQSSTKQRDIVLDFFLGIGTTVAVAQKLNRKWIGVEMGSHFRTFYEGDGRRKIGVLGRLKIVLSGDQKFNVFGHPRHPQLSRNINWQGGGFFKYYELEQYADALRKVRYEDSDLFENPYEDPYSQYVFMRDIKMLEALEIDYENNKVEVDVSKLYEHIDVPETLSNLLGRWIKRMTPDFVEFEDGEKIDTKNLDYKLIKPLIWW